MNNALSAHIYELEKFGDECVASGDCDKADSYYKDALNLILDDLDNFEDRMEDFLRITAKVREVHPLEEEPPLSAEESIAEMREGVDEAISNGNLRRASHLSFLLGQELETNGDKEGAESAYRQSVALARETGVADPELVLASFTSLARFLSPSLESVRLSAELTEMMCGRTRMGHLMRCAEARYTHALGTLELAEQDVSYLDESLVIARESIAKSHDSCQHELARNIGLRVAEILRSTGRDLEAEQWQAEADENFDPDIPWYDLEIPGHVHLWEIHLDLNAIKRDL